MKNINPLIGILTTALVVAISIIVMMGIYIGKLSKDIRILRGEETTEQESVAQEEAKEIPFTQFDTTFYKVEDCAVEKIECATIAEKIDYEFDIDADSSMDKLTVEIDKKGKKGVIFKINGREFENGTDMKGAKFFLVDLNRFDNTIEVVIYDEGENGKSHYLIYSKSGSRMKLLEDIDGKELYLDEIGKVTSLSYKAPKIDPEVFGKYYEFEEGKLNEQTLNAARVKNIEFTAEGEYFTTDINKLDDYYDMAGLSKTKKEIETIDEDSLEKSEITKLTAEDKFEIKSFTDDYNIEVELKDGRKGYVISDYYLCNIE
ncbi:MAG: hypothetical protein K6D97_07235 [Clostridia bacterium]|nr:hypothetical protein [Clostridia bacterium]